MNISTSRLLTYATVNVTKRDPLNYGINYSMLQENSKTPARIVKMSLDDVDKLRGTFYLFFLAQEKNINDVSYKSSIRNQHVFLEYYYNRKVFCTSMFVTLNANVYSSGKRQQTVSMANPYICRMVAYYFWEFSWNTLLQEQRQQSWQSLERTHRKGGAR